MRQELCKVALLVIGGYQAVSGFVLQPGKTCRIDVICARRATRVVSSNQPLHFRLLAKKDDDDEEEDKRKGMEKAFEELAALESLGDDDSVEKPMIEMTDKGFKKAMEDLEPLKDDLNAPPPPPPEAEVKVYSDMVAELEKDTLYSDMMSDMGGTPQPPPKEEEDLVVEDVAPIERSQEDMDAFMNKALEEALKEAQAKTPEELAKASENILDDKEMMKEIEAVFEKANQELLDSLDVIREEQADLAKASAEKSAQDRMDVDAENAERMEQAQASVSKLLEKVNQETAEVEKAVQDLKAAQEQMAEDPLSSLSDLKGGFVKQGALVGAVLFTFRSFSEVIAMLGQNGETHVAAAVIQGAIALACAAAFFFL